MQPFGSHANASRAASYFNNPVQRCHHSPVGSYKPSHFNAVHTLVAGVVVVELTLESSKHEPIQMRHVDIPPDFDHVRLDWLRLFTLFLRVFEVILALLFFPYSEFTFIGTEPLLY